MSLGRDLIKFYSGGRKEKRRLNLTSAKVEAEVEAELGNNQELSKVS